MAGAKGLDLTGIRNVGEFYSNHYLTALLEGDLKSTLKAWAAAEKEGGAKTPAKRVAALANKFFTWQGEAAGASDVQTRLGPAQTLHAHLLEALGYTRRPGVEEIGEGEVIPVVTTEDVDRRPYLWVLEAPFATEEDDADPLGEPPHAAQLPETIDPSEVKLPEQSWRELLDGRLLRRDDAPRWVVFLAGTDVFLIDRDKWPQGKYLHFAIAELMGRRESKAMRALSGLLHRDVLLPEGGQSLLDTLDENSHKHAFAVSTDLKYGARKAIELIANEAIRHLREVRKGGVFGDDELARKLTRESLMYLYRLLFLFYVEARSAEMEDDQGRAVVPMKSDAYRLGYSLETLRDLELVPLTSVEAREGHYLDTSLRRLFRLVFEGHGYGQRELEYDGGASTDFEISGLRSPLFDEDRTPILKGVKLRNEVVQRVLQLLSLSKEGGRKRRGRISYATLGINQLGAVYEGLLSYTGFFAQEDLYEIRAAKEMKDPEARTYFVPSGKIGDYFEEEKVKDERGRPIVHPKGTYLFRLAGRDREKSASYYTPEVLTRCLTKYTLKERLGEKGKEGYVSADEILKLTVCEPAMGSGAFLNEAVNQLADAYLERKQEELGRVIPPERYAIERQRVKYYIAVNNCYGVDLNPLAAELGKVSLWLNVLFPGAQAPYFDQRIAVGNSLIGARREVFDGADLMVAGKKENWLSQVPKKVAFGEKRPAGSVYHFLVPDLGMAPFDRDKVVKELEPEAVKRIKAWRKEICRAYSAEEVERLVELSDRIDVLWDEHVAMRGRVLGETRQAYAVWPRTEDEAGGEKVRWVPGVEECEDKARELEKGTAPGRRLKGVMDYWCALWFWPISEAGVLPGRGEWLGDVAVLLDGGVDVVANDEARIRVALQTAERRRPQHWEGSFAEVFLRRGFDLMLGNPPWIKAEWREAGILGDRDPRVQLRKMSAKQVADARADALNDEQGRREYLDEFAASEGAQAYLNSTQAYSLLRGVQTNLYKCFFVVALRLGGPDGAAGFFHLKGMFDDPKGGTLRSRLAPQVAWHFHFINKLLLFAEIEDQKHYEVTVLRTGRPGRTSFRICSNVFHPSTIDASLSHDGRGDVPAIKTEADVWDLRGHRSRIVDVDEEALDLFARLYDGAGTPALEARLPLVHSQEVLDVLRKFADAPRRLGDLGDAWQPISEHFHESRQQADGTIRRETKPPATATEWIVSGPHFYVATPFNKTPNEGCRHNQDYQVVDLTRIGDEYLPRTNYVPACSPAEYRKRTPHWNGRPVTDYYRHVHREMVAPTGERTIVPAIVPKGAANVHTVFGIAIAAEKTLVFFSALCSSIPFDFFVKSAGAAHVNRAMVEQFALPETHWRNAIISRGARLNCLSSAYAELWELCYDPSFRSERHSKSDHRLSEWDELNSHWERAAALRTPYERRQALVELDALAALALGLSAEELALIYRIQFPVLQQYERETYYDHRGMIVFTTNRGLSGIGLDRKQWEEIKDIDSQASLPEFASDYVPPFDRCDRETDMRQAYNHFLTISPRQKGTQS